jgi:raffinose/stachyose/melibiose transport system permease protein
MMNRKRLKSPKQKPDAVSIVIGILLGVYVLGLLIPTIWAALTAFMDVKSYQQAYLFSNFENGQFPFKFTMENFVIANDFLEVQAVNTGEFWYADTMYINSLKFALFSAVSFTICCTLVSYLTAKFDFKFSKIIYGFVIVAMSLPIVGSMPSEIRMLQRLGIYNTWLSIPILRFNFLNVYFLVLFAST